MGIFSRNRRQSDDREPVSLDYFARQALPRMSDFYDGAEAWINEAIEANNWYKAGEFLNATKTGMKALAIAPADQSLNAVSEVRTPIEDLGREPSSTSDSDSLAYLKKIIDWIDCTGWLDQSWSNPMFPPSLDAEVAWGLYPTAVIALVERAQRAGRHDLVDRYKPVAVDRMRAMTEALSSPVAAWVKAQQR